MRYHLTPAKMAIINKLTRSAGKDVEKCWQECGSMLVGMQTGAITLENSVRFPQKIKNTF